MSVSDCNESTSLRFEWTLRGLGELFENSKGDAKSKVTKSPKFGGGKWQILFYANSGTVNAEGHGYVSLYLTCEPTTEERERAVNGKWVRDGVYKFGFELRNLAKTVLFNSKEAHDHSFTYKTVNWGWAQFARRDAIYYQASSVRQQDSIVITCTITSAPAPPATPPLIPRHPVPRDMLDAIGSLLDDPSYSDVEFVIPRRRGNRKQTRSIYAARKLLNRLDYFSIMFRSGFAEGLQTDVTSNDVDGVSVDVSLATNHNGDTESILSEDAKIAYLGPFEDSDDEDDEEEGTVPHLRLELPLAPSDPVLEKEHLSTDSRPTSWASVAEGDLDALVDLDDPSHSRNVKPKLSHPSSPRSESGQFPRDEQRNTVQEPDESQNDIKTAAIPGPQKIRVVVQDVAYATYRAVLYYIYTDTIVFAPLASTFHGHHIQAANLSDSSSLSLAKLKHLVNTGSSSTPAATAEGPMFPHSHASKASITQETAMSLIQPTSRRAWIAEWENRNPGRPRPCSAKAVYRLADKLDLQELKDRAFQHIIKSLTVDNVAYEVFSDFSAAFEDVRKVEVAFFLEHWTEIRGSDAMRNVWQQIRLGRHPGFEEVWPLIALNLEFKPRTPGERDGGEDASA